MNKDAVLATIIGFVVGLIITGMLLAGPKLAGLLPHFAFSLPKISQPKAKATPAASPASQNYSVTIESPLDQSIESESDILVSGGTEAGSTVVIQGNTGDAVSAVNGDGKYAGKISLVEGENVITVTSYLKDKKATQTVTVYYTSENL